MSICQGFNTGETPDMSKFVHTNREPDIQYPIKINKFGHNT